MLYTYYGFGIYVDGIGIVDDVDEALCMYQQIWCEKQGW